MSVYKGTITNSCTCMFCDACDMGYNYDPDTFDMTCPECGKEGEYAGSCFGCYDEAVADVRDNLFNPWHQSKGGGPYVVHGSGMGWLKQRGTSVECNDWDDGWKQLQINGDYTIRFSWDDSAHTFEAVRGSHDEMGALFIYDVLPEQLPGMEDDSNYYGSRRTRAKVDSTYECPKGHGRYYDDGSGTAYCRTCGAKPKVANSNTPTLNELDEDPMWPVDADGNPVPRTAPWTTQEVNATLTVADPARFIAFRRSVQAGLRAKADRVCYKCNGTGEQAEDNRHDPYGPHAGTCTVCGGTGRRTSSTHTPASNNNGRR